MIDPGEGEGDANARRGVVEWLSDFVRSDNTGGMFYGWRLVVIGFLIILVGRELSEALTATAYISMAFGYIAIDPPWNVVTIAGGYLLSMWFAGWGTDRFGPRRMAQVWLPLVGLVVLLTTMSIPGAQQAAFSSIAALGLVGAYVPAITILNHWFRDRLALALALMLFGVAIGRVIFDSLLSLPLLVEDWRLITLVSGGAIVVAGLLLARTIRNRPEDWAEYPDGLAPAPAEIIPDYSWREAMRSLQFWMLMAAACCVAASATITGFYDGPIIISREIATFETISKAGLFEEYAWISGILIGGLVSYRFPVRYVLSVAAVAQTVGTVVLIAGYGPILWGSVVLLRLASGMATATGIAVFGIYFGRRSFGMITVTTLFIKQVASTGLLAAAGYTIDVMGGYVPGFVATAIVSLIGAGLFWMLGQPRLSLSQRRLVSRGAGVSD